jgi:glycosyltransferase involved in cell wall biosynthesis
MNKDPLITVITVSLNSEKNIAATIDSVAKQSYPHVEYIIIDGGSVDGTLDIIKRNERHISFYISEPDDGLYHAMNKGILKATGDVLIFLNSDDRFADSEVLSDVSKTFVDFDMPHLVYGNAWIEFRESSKQWIPPHNLSRMRLAIGTICHQAIFARKDLFDLTGGFSEDYKIVSDYEWLLKVVHTDGIRSKYIDRDISIMSTDGLSHTTKWEDERIEVMSKYYSPAEIFLWRKLTKIIKSMLRLIRFRRKVPK